jgi:hypothetical protein
MSRPSDSVLLSPRFLFFAGTLLVLLAWTLSPRARALAGLFDHGRWFLDSQAVLAASDAAKEGFNPEAPNPYDAFQRPHSYSDWWFGLGKLGLTRDDNFLVGGIWVLLFLAAVFLTLRPHSRGEALWLVLLAGSPPVMLGVMRANNDLVIFAVLAVALLALRSATNGRLVLAGAAIAVAIGLKFYPVAALAVFFLVRPSRRMWWVTGAAVLIGGIVVVSVASQVMRGIFHLEPEIYTMGAKIWLTDLGVSAALARPVAVVLLVGAASVAVWRGWTGGLARDDVAPAARPAMVLAAALLVFCFLGTVNFGYRWIYALWLAPWCWAQRGEGGAARVLVWLLPVVLWQDALLCVVTSFGFTDLAPAQYERIFLVWRLATQPLTWLVMILLTGWLLELGLKRVREVRA